MMTSIMIIDDTMLARAMLTKFVSQLRPSWTISQAKDGNDALAKAKGLSLDVALVDYNMPGMNGIELARVLRIQFPHIKMALITANIQDYIAQEATSVGMEFITKPIERDNIACFLNSVGA